tara:strand:+ start:2643 stop:3890 length:1248 start_codon:yes stop_codon:yes gene_type:complete
MLQAVTEPARDYEGLQNYILGGRKRSAPPAAVPSQRAQSARLDSKPGAQPKSRQPIPTSSQRPGKQTNQKIPYARMMLSSVTKLSGRPTSHDLGLGDIVFVEKLERGTGRKVGSGAGAPNYITRVAGLAQLNHCMMEEKLSLATHADAIRSTRRRFYAEQVVELQKQIDHAFGTIPADRGKMAAAARRELERLEALKAGVGADAAYYNAPDVAIDAVDPVVDWRAMKSCARFTLDGVVIGVDDDEKNMRDETAYQQKDDGLLVNVCVAGPTQCRNTRKHTEVKQGSLERIAQPIDHGCRLLDNFFVGLFYKEVRNGRDEVTGLQYYYKPFSGRQIEEVFAKRRPLANGRAPPYRAGGISMGPTYTEFDNIVHVFRLGKVMDTNLVQGEHAQVLLDVVVQEMTLIQLDEMYPQVAA